MREKIRVTIFCEHNQDRSEPVLSVYPQGMHEAIAQGFASEQGFEVRIATQDMPEHGLPEQVLDVTDVLIWWSHLDGMAFSEEVADSVCRHVTEKGMGLIVLHSALFSKPFMKLTGCYFDAGAWGRYRATLKGERERLWSIAPGHPILDGVADVLEIPKDEMYGEPMLVAEPDKVLMLTWWEGGEASRGAWVYERGRGRIFVFTPGHETFPIYYREDVRHILRNAARWTAPSEYMKVPPRTSEHLDAAPREDLSHCM